MCRSFPVAASILWNTLPDDVKSALSVSAAKDIIGRVSGNSFILCSLVEVAL